MGAELPRPGVETIPPGRYVMLSVRDSGTGIAPMCGLIDERMRERLTSNAAVRDRVPQIEREVAAGALSPMAGADTILRTLGMDV